MFLLSLQLSFLLLTTRGLRLTIPDVDDTGMCGSSAEERQTMPFAINAAPLDEQGNTLEDYSCNGFNSGCGVYSVAHGDGNVMTFTAPESRRYSFAIVPQKLYVPTEGVTKPFFDKINNDNQTNLENRLSLIPPDPAHPGLSDIVNAQVLQFSEGAYVEGVIRFEVVPPPTQIARRPNARAP
ncbi:MAG: hypothetical protein HYT87_18625 [Nitrospirae bacterium]|nr:hypothetical protein [Nitrospirota bacterium]